MCTISYEKCACLLVMLAVLSCSGSRIDNLMAMTDIGKRNVAGGGGGSDHHRVRHQRHRPPDPPPRPRCPEPDVSWKAYRAAVVVLARVESKSARCRDDCTVFFKVLETLKNSSIAVDERIGLKLPPRGGGGGAVVDADCDRFLVKPPKIDQRKEYVLFLDTDGAHNFDALFVPQVRRNKTLLVVRRVVSPDFKLRPLKLEPQEPQKPRNSKNKRLKLVCKAKGFPIPIIYWKRNDRLLHPNHHYRITNKKRKSTLVIRNYNETADSGNYKCVAKGADGREASYIVLKSKNIASFADRKPCSEDRSSYCLNGSKCFFIESLREYMCECEADYTGRRCDTKTTSQSSRYPQTPVYTCQVGLYTNYDNC